jgi:hypothetical protein
MHAKLARLAIIGAGTLALTSVAGAAFADQDPVGDPVGVPVHLEFEGELSMTVDDNDIYLVEQTTGVAAGQRWFTGTLGDVTVKDTRAAHQIDPDVYWWVEGVASDFVGTNGEDDILAENLGWTPAFTDPSYTGEVTEGPAVLPVLDYPHPDAVGLVGGEFLVQVASTSDSGLLLPENSWTANAGLILKVLDTTQAGSYESQLTLTLFE